MNDKKYEVKNDIKLKIFITKEILKGYKPYLSQKELQNIVISLYDLYYNVIATQEFIEGINRREFVFLCSKYHNEDSKHNQDCLYHEIEYKGEKYFVASDSYGNVDCLSIYSLRRILPQVYDYASNIDGELSLEGLCHVLHSLNAKCSGIETVVRNHQVEVLLRAYIIDGIVKDLVIKNEDIDKITEFINMLNREFGVSVIVPEIKIKRKIRINKMQISTDY